VYFVTKLSEVSFVLRFSCLASFICFKSGYEI
jgi:hypothetical protein